MKFYFTWSREGNLRLLTGDHRKAVGVPLEELRLGVKSALALSVRKWEEIVKRLSGTEVYWSDGAVDTCALCIRFMSDSGACSACPICKKTRQEGCVGTPYEEFEGAVPMGRPINDDERPEALKVAKRELGFLRKLQKEHA